MSVEQSLKRSPSLISLQVLDGLGNPQVIPDINVYQQKKNLAQGMMDLALLSANANQLRYVLESYARHPYYWFSLISISVSLILQVSCPSCAKRCVCGQCLNIPIQFEMWTP